jgi:hypothetical protein
MMQWDCHRGPDRCEVGWNGENEKAEPVALGIYFCRLKTSAGFEETRNLVMVK